MIGGAGGVDPACVGFDKGPHLRRYQIVERGALPAILDQQVMAMRECPQPFRKTHLILFDVIGMLRGLVGDRHHDREQILGAM